MAATNGTRSRTNPQTKAQRLRRVAELTERIDTRQSEVDDLGKERVKLIKVLRKVDGATYAEIAEYAGKSPQALHKAVNKASVQ